MIKVAVLDDYQDVFRQIVDVQKYKDKFEFKIFNNPFSDEKEAIVELEDFEVLFIMRERTPMTKTLIESLSKLKYIMTSGRRNKAIDLETTKKNYTGVQVARLPRIIHKHVSLGGHTRAKQR